MHSTAWPRQSLTSSLAKWLVLALLLALVAATTVGVPLQVGREAAMSFIDSIDLTNVTINKYLQIELSNGSVSNIIKIESNGTVYYVDVTTSQGTARVATRDKPRLAFAGNMLFINEYSVELDFAPKNVTVKIDGDAAGTVFIEGAGAAKPLGFVGSLKQLLSELKSLVGSLKDAVRPFIDIAQAIMKAFDFIAQVVGLIKTAIEVFWKYIVEPGYLHIAVILWVLGELVIAIASIPQRGPAAITDWISAWVSRIERVYYFLRSLVDLLLKLIDLVIPF